MIPKTVVVPKNGNGDILSSLAGYRPISLGTVMGKVLERLLQHWPLHYKQMSSLIFVPVFQQTAIFSHSFVK